MKTFLMLEIAVEVAHQLPDINHSDMPRAEYRWSVVEIAQDIINKNIIDNNSEDIDEIINAYLVERGLI